MIEADTIFARASAPGAAAIALVRISGPHAIAALTALTNKPAPSARIATLCTLIDPACQRVLDRALVLVFQAPHSYTGEDMVELHLHGGHAVVASVLDALGNCAGLRMAQPG
ncbi:MAG: tRNA uridine-5-carboxymethylaminomethyl(34) synthesis GTPase MnmE, partial [Pseudomonadota bacterium]